VRLARDDAAASPLVVLTTFVIVAVLITIAVYALVFDKPSQQVQLTPTHAADGSLAFDVSKSSGGLSWSDVRVRFLDRAGSDQSLSYLHLPRGSIDREDRITVAPQPPAGTYLVQVLKGETELSRLAVTV
jgi:hypothetical protein